MKGRLLLLGIAVLLALPIAVSLARSGDGRETEPVTYDVRGVYKGDQRVRVTGGNRHTRHELEGKTVRFDMTKAEVHTPDLNDDGYRDRRDIRAGRGVRVRGEFDKYRPDTRTPLLEVFAGRPPNCPGLAGNDRFCP